MKRLWVQMVTVMAGLLILSASVGAATIQGVEATINLQNNIVQISGEIGSGNGEQVTIRVTDPEGNIEYIDQCESDEQGQFLFSWTLGDPIEGTYNIQLRGDGVTDSVYSHFTYQNIPLPPKQTIFVDASFKVGEEENATELLARQMLHADVQVRSEHETDLDVMVVVGLFDGTDELVDYAYLPTTISENETIDFSGGFRLPRDVTNHHVKVYVLEGNQFSAGTIIPNTIIELPTDDSN